METNTATTVHTAPRVAIVGGGPAGLMAAEGLMAQGASVELFDGMPSVGRKFLLAGKGGLNLTHSEALPRFKQRFGDRAAVVAPWLDAWGPQQACEWAAGLGVPTFVGSSGRVFPQEMKAAPLLRAWLHRLRTQGLRLHMRHRWAGWGTVQDAPTLLQFNTPSGPWQGEFDAVVLALGGASWPRLGSDAAWVPWLTERGVAIKPLQPSNCGFDVQWSPYLAQRFAGVPIKSVSLSFTDSLGQHFSKAGEFVITSTGIEGSLVYAASSLLRDEIARHGNATLRLDLVPGRDLARLSEALARGRGARSLPNHLKEHAGLHGAKAALLRERWSAAELAQRLTNDPAALAAELKAWPLTVTAARPVAEAISTAGGVAFEALTPDLMLHALPGVFCAGEMLDWEAPTGGYLLTASMASGWVAAAGLARWWANAPQSASPELLSP